MRVLIAATDEVLARFALSLVHRAGTPVFTVKEANGVPAMADRVRRLVDRGA